MSTFPPPGKISVDAHARAINKNSTARLIVNKINSQISYCNTISNLQTQHIHTSQSNLCFAQCNITVMVIITFKTILNEKVGYHFAR